MRKWSNGQESEGTRGSMEGGQRWVRRKERNVQGGDRERRDVF